MNSKIKNKSFEYTQNNFKKIFIVFLPVYILNILNFFLTPTINYNDLYSSDGYSLSYTNNSMDSLLTIIISIITIVITVYIFNNIKNDNNLESSSISAPYSGLTFRNYISIVLMYFLYGIFISVIIFATIFLLALVAGIIIGIFSAISISTNLLSFIIVITSIALTIIGLYIIARVFYAYKYSVILLTNDLKVGNPKLGYISYLKRSKKIMKGFKKQALLLDLSLFGWYLLSILIIPLIFTLPYFSVINANYLDYVLSNQDDFVTPTRKGEPIITDPEQFI